MTRKGGWPSSGFGSRLRTLREAAGLSQKSLAERATCTLEAISRLERGLTEPAWPLAIAICDALGVSTEAFRQANTSSAEKPKRGRPRKGLEESVQVVEEQADLPPQPGKRGKAEADVQAPAPSGEKDAPPASLPPAQEKPHGRKPRKPRGG